MTYHIISTKILIVCLCLLTAINPIYNNFLKLSKNFTLTPPKQSIISLLNINGALTNFNPFPAVFDNKNPKSI